MKTPLYDAVKNYNPELRVHMPGHSGATLISPLYSASAFDITELDFSDNLLSAKGVILESEKLTASAYHSKYCLYFTNGCTCALFTAICVAKERVKQLEILGTPHKSIVNACELFGLDYKVVNIISKNAEGILITTPDYYGNIVDVSAIREGHPHAFIIVDEAHGAHFAFSSLLPKNTTGEADFVVNGMHKTLPVFTGGAILRTNSLELYQKAEEYRAKIHSTSPSYLIMTSMDFARGYMSENGERLYAELKKIIDNLKLPTGFRIVKTDDFTRIVIEVPEQTTGYAVSKDAKKSDIYFELVEDRYLVCIATPFNMDKLYKLEKLNPNPKAIARKNLFEFVGKVAPKDIGLYPPGKIYIKKGELITKEVIELLSKDAERVFGLE